MMEKRRLGRTGWDVSALGFGAWGIGGTMWIGAKDDESLQNLGMERVDLLQLHVWRDEWLDQDGWRDAFLALKTGGKARFLGISVNDHEAASALRAVASGLFDTVQVIYNVF